MSKELEEIKSIVAIHFGALGFLNPSENEQILKDRDKVLNALQRLESIDNAKPSEALKTLEVLDKTISPLLEPILVEYEDDLSDKITANYFALKDALLKAQEQEKVLEIIKNKAVDILLIIKYNNVYDYNSAVWLDGRPKLNEEEFEVIKKWTAK